MRNDGIKQPSLEWKRKEENTAALVMIHGFTGSPFTTWGNFPEVLSRCESLREWDIALLRYQTHLMPDIAGIWLAEAPLGRLAMMLNTTVTQGELADYPVLAFVAHSMGGLILQQALVGNPELAARTSHVFMFGTPSAGLRKARFFKPFKRQFADMVSGSRFITRLRAGWTETFGRSCPFKLFIVAGETDEFVPPESSLDPFPRCNQYVVAGNHCEIVGPSSDQDPSVQLLVRGIIGDAAPAGPWNAARVALESRQFQEAIRLLEPQKHLLDPAASVTLALALEAVGRQQDAIALLESARGRTSTDAMGVLAGRLKRRWLQRRRNEDAIRATALYQEAYDLSVAAGDENQSFYHVINLAFMALLHNNDRLRAEELSRQALAHAKLAYADYWRYATEGDANLILGQNCLAIRNYQSALNAEPLPREIQSIYTQAQLIALHLKQPAFARTLESLFRNDRAVLLPPAPPGEDQVSER